MLRLVITLAMLAGGVLLITSATVTGFAMWLTVAFIASLAIGTLVGR
jgi:hypothetical protein